MQKSTCAVVEHQDSKLHSDWSRTKIEIEVREISKMVNCDLIRKAKVNWWVQTLEIIKAENNTHVQKDPIVQPLDKKQSTKSPRKSNQFFCDQIICQLQRWYNFGPQVLCLMMPTSYSKSGEKRQSKMRKQLYYLAES